MYPIIMHTPKTIDEYIATFPPVKQRFLKAIKQSIKSVLPNSTEHISYGIPTFSLPKGHVIHFGAFSSHIGLYPGAQAIVTFQQKLVPYKTSKGAIQLPFNEPLPLELIKEITEYCAQQMK